MLQLLPQNDTLTQKFTSPNEAVTYINSYIEKHHCENMSVDISLMNVIDACFVSTMCSTNHYLKYPKGKFNWRISSKLVYELNKGLELGNSEYTCVNK